MRSWLPSSRSKGALEALLYLLGLTFRGFAFVHLGFAALALVLGEEAWAVWRILGVRRSFSTPVLSAKKAWRPATWSWGKTARKSTTIPIPPIHWVKPR